MNVRYRKTEDKRKFYSVKLKEQKGRCAICQRRTRLVVDHNHNNKKMRGLLCYKHNSGLGLFNDDPKLLIQAAEYLIKNGHGKDSPKLPIAGRITREDKELALKVLKNPEFTSERAKGRELARLLNIPEVRATKRIQRLGQKLGQMSHEVQNP